MQLQSQLNEAGSGSHRQNLCLWDYGRFALQTEQYSWDGAQTLTAMMLPTTMLPSSQADTAKRMLLRSLPQHQYSCVRELGQCSTVGDGQSCRLCLLQHRSARPARMYVTLSTCTLMPKGSCLMRLSSAAGESYCITGQAQGGSVHDASSRMPASIWQLPDCKLMPASMLLWTLRCLSASCGRTSTWWQVRLSLIPVLPDAALH